MRRHRPAAFGAAFLLLSLTAGAQRPAGDSTADLLSELIRIDTSNPPGHEGQVDAFLAERLRPLGFEIEIVPTPEPGKSHLIARLRGDGSRRPVLLAAHADVVGVEPEKWTVDPFSGLQRDGYVFGRGAIDFKGGMAVFTRAVMMLAENRVPLARDVILLVEADEESAPYNTSWLARTHWPQMDCEFALNEGGWIMTDDRGRVRYVSVSTADKSSARILITATGTSTHSSMPRPDNAIATLSKAMAKLADYETPLRLVPETRQFLATLGRTSEPLLAEAFATLARSSDPEALAAADRLVSRDPLMHAIIRNTLAPVLMNAGFRSNVIPGSAEATVNARLVPGADPNAVVEEIRRVIDDARVDVRLATPTPGPSQVRPSSTETDLFRALQRQAQSIFPGAEVTPYVFQAGTDAGAWRSRGVPVYGIYPYPISPDDLARMHGNDERVAIESLRLGTEWVYRTLVEVASR